MTVSPSSPMSARTVIEAAVTLLARRAAGYEARATAIFNGRIIAEELKSNCREIEKLANHPTTPTDGDVGEIVDAMTDANAERIATANPLPLERVMWFAGNILSHDHKRVSYPLHEARMVRIVVAHLVKEISRSSAATSEPVAWQYRINPEDRWSLTGDKNDLPLRCSDPLMVRPLFTVPPSSAETAEAIEARDRYKKMYNAEVKAAAESKARCNEALGWSEQQLQAAKSSHEGQLRNTLAFKAEKEAAELRLAEAVNIIWRGTFNNKADEDRAQKFVNGPVGISPERGERS